MAQLYDLNRDALDRVLDVVLVEQACNTAVDETLQLAAAQVPAPAPQDYGHYDRVLVLEYLLQLYEAVRLQVEQRAQEMPPLAWLWCLRRMPRDVVHGPLPQSHAVLQQMAEVMGCHSHMGQAGVNATAPVTINAELASRVSAFCATVRLLHRIQSLVRRHKRGAEFAFAAGPLPTFHESQSVTEAINLSDARISSGESAFFNRLGTVYLDRPLVVAGQQPPPMLAVAAQARESRWEPTTLIPANQIWATYATDLRALNPLASLVAKVGANGWWPPVVTPLCALLAVTARLVDERPELVDQLLQFGYYEIPAPEFDEAADQLLADVGPEISAVFPNTVVPNTGDGLLQALLGVPLSVWPLTSGAPVHRTAATLVVDLASATRLLDISLEPPTSVGAAARALAFEESAQNMINSSSWSNPELAAHRGEDLKKANGDNLTDIDAIGGKGGTILLLDCKSYVYRSDYEVGPPNTVKNVADELANKATHMKDVVIPTLMANMPEVFAPKNAVIGVVCTPVPLYVHIGDATEEVAPGLRRVSSLLELRRWLADN